MKITESNYFSPEVNKAYCSNSQLKSFMDCEARTMAEIRGLYEREPTESMLLGSYVDCKLLTPDKMPEFIESHPEIFKKDGTLYAKFETGNTMVERCLADDKFMSSLKGDHQTIFTGELYGLPFRAKLDVFNDGKYITDLKTTASLTKEEYDRAVGKYVNFAQHFKYDLQGAIYQQIVYQNTGKMLPYFISVVTSQKHPRKRILEVDQDSMDKALQEAIPYILRVKDLKAGLVEPKRCEDCDYCADTEILTGAVDWLGREWDDEEE